MKARKKRPALTVRTADYLERVTFALDALMGTDCVRPALAPSVERFRDEGQALVAEMRRRQKQAAS
jgi:hypothetical protein